MQSICLGPTAPMRILITHNNFPAQFRHIAEYLGRSGEHQIIFATKTPRNDWNIPGVIKAIYSSPETTTKDTHILAQAFDEGVRHGHAMLDLCNKLKKGGFTPDVILGHSGWGQTMFLRDVFPDTPFIGYFEWYYSANSAEVLFDDTEISLAQKAMLRTRNAPILQDLASCCAGITPTAWQHTQFPIEFQSKLLQAHDGIDTRYFAPASNGKLDISTLSLPNADLSGAEELVTYSARGMEPYRGFPQFYEALPAILEARPKCHILIVGTDRTCYSPRLPKGQTYKQIMQEKVKVDESRVHFTGLLPYGKYKQVLQASTVHVYLTWPFVLSWSLLEAMSCGCLVVASDTEPVREVISHEKNGLFTDFHSSEKIAISTVNALAKQEELVELRRNARNTVLERYCLSKCLPVHLDLLNQTAQKGSDRFTTPNPTTEKT
nr:glycosyltransferase [uncultured Pseudodesulfovibrio sp.]